MNLLSYEAFKKFDASVALSILESTVSRNSPSPAPRLLTNTELSSLLTPFDIKRLESYADSMLDYHVVLDLVPTIASLFFGKKLETGLPPAQQAILLALGLQRKNVEALETELGITSTQTLALFGKLLRKMTKSLEDIQKASIASELPAEPTLAGRSANGPNKFVALQQTIEQDLADSAVQLNGEDDDATKKEQRKLLDTLNMEEFAIGQEGDWTEAEKQVERLASGKGSARLSSTVSVKVDKLVDDDKAKVVKGKDAGAKDAKKRRESGGEKGGKKKMRRE